MTFLYQIDDLFVGKIISRPSKTCKSPYVADVVVEGFGNGTIYKAHAPSLGCGGLCEAGCDVVLTMHPDPKTCMFVIQQSVIRHENNESVIGIHPKHAEKIVKRLLHIGKVPTLESVTNIKSEVKISNCRFDFTCIDKSGIHTIIEVKHVPLADFEILSKKERKKKKIDNYNYDWNSKISYFPEGYRKNCNAAISPRALKHIQELELLKMTYGDKIRCIMCYVIQRPDSNIFQPSPLDHTYYNAFVNAHNNGVEIIPIQVDWNYEGECNYMGTLDIKI
jgi:DNA-binding sugar fermentation-stimulating protein